MKPVAVFRHVAHEGPGWLGDLFDQRGIPRILIAVDRGDPLPASTEAYSGLVFMGGPMSVNDDLPWIPAVLALIREAVARDIPVLGHCLGGQLMAKALGAQVTGNPVKEIGWAEVRATDTAEAKHWLGETSAFPAFHWHGETFAIPEGACRILASAHCVNQAFAVGPHLALQCHVEMTPGMIDEWCRVGADEITAAHSAAVQSRETILAGTGRHLPAMRAAAEQLYTRWLAGLKPS